MNRIHKILGVMGAIIIVALISALIISADREMEENPPIVEVPLERQYFYIDTLTATYCRASDFLQWLLTEEQKSIVAQQLHKSDDVGIRSLDRLRSMIPETRDIVIRSGQDLRDRGVTPPTEEECERFFRRRVIQ